MPSTLALPLRSPVAFTFGLLMSYDTPGVIDFGDTSTYTTTVFGREGAITALTLSTGRSPAACRTPCATLA